MKLEGEIRGRERYIGGRRLVTSTHEFTRNPKGILNPPISIDRAEIDMEMTCPGCPVQYEGKINGKNAYYRDRHGNWSLEIYDGELFKGNPLYAKSGISKEIAGWAGMQAAERRIIKYAMDFAKKNPGYETPFYLEDWMIDGYHPCDY